MCLRSWIFFADSADCSVHIILEFFSLSCIIERCLANLWPILLPCLRILCLAILLEQILAALPLLPQVGLAVLSAPIPAACQDLTLAPLQTRSSVFQRTASAFLSCALQALVAFQKLKLLLKSEIFFPQLFSSSILGCWLALWLLSERRAEL